LRLEPGGQSLLLGRHPIEPGNECPALLERGLARWQELSQLGVADDHRFDHQEVCAD
jgi:hypothetical protein